jgi:unsaturated rhamnogalacturonyl hydrolase
MLRHCLIILVACGLLTAVVLGAEPAELSSPNEVARELLQVYGRELKSVTYIPALAVSNRWRFGELAKDGSQRAVVVELLGASRAVPKTHVEFAGHLVYATVAHDAEGALRDQCVAAVRLAADQLFEPGLKQVQLPGPQEMSDAVFMCGPILCEAGALTGERRYFDSAAQYLAEMRRLRERDDHLYRHGYLCDAAWGRGNGFPAVGTAWCLTLLPQDHPGRDEMLAAFRRHMGALVKQQTANGLWRQVVDAADAYEEFSATAMIGFSLQRGVSSGWLDRETYQPHANRAWQAICHRIQPGGKLIDVCEGTGTQKSLLDYLNRKAIRGVDDRGGAMALLFAVERLAAEGQDKR